MYTSSSSLNSALILFYLPLCFWSDHSEFYANWFIFPFLDCIPVYCEVPLATNFVYSRLTSLYSSGLQLFILASCILYTVFLLFSEIWELSHKTEFKRNYLKKGLWLMMEVIAFGLLIFSRECSLFSLNMTHHYLLLLYLL